MAFLTWAAIAQRLARGGGGDIGRRIGDRFAHLADLVHRTLRGLDHHGLFEFVLRFIVLGEAQLVMSDRYDIAVLQGMLLDELAVDVSAIGAVQVLKERVIEDIDDQRVMATDSTIVDADVIVRETANRVPLLVHVVFRHHLAIQAKYQPCHACLLTKVQPSQPRIRSRTPLLAGKLSATCAMTTETLSRPPLSFVN